MPSPAFSAACGVAPSLLLSALNSLLPPALALSSPPPLRGVESAQQEMHELRLPAPVGRLVLRVWRASSRFASLGVTRRSPDPKCRALHRLAREPAAVAKIEVAGYRLARAAVPGLEIPEVLLFREGEGGGPAFALFRFVEAPGPEPRMVKARLEFGAEEEHLRHGRLPSAAVLPYCSDLIAAFLLPLAHRCWSEPPAPQIPRTTTPDLLAAYAAASSLLSSRLLPSSPPPLRAAVPSLPPLLSRLSSLLPGLPPLPPTLVHLDLQPQNLLFGPAGIVGVLDFEEAAVADPRLEVALVCRRVCADLEQAGAVWREFSSVVVDSYAWGDGGNGGDRTGGMAFWLLLEHAHVCVTLMLQLLAKDLSGARGTELMVNEKDGGLLEKLEREVGRRAKLEELLTSETK